MNTDLYKIRCVWQSELCACVCVQQAQRWLVWHLKQLLVSTQLLMNLQSYRKPSIVITGM